MFIDLSSSAYSNSSNSDNNLYVSTDSSVHTNSYDAPIHELFEHQIQLLREENANLKHELQNALNKVNVEKFKTNTIIEAACVLIDKEKLMDATNRLINAKKNKINFEKLLDIAVKEIK